MRNIKKSLIAGAVTTALALSANTALASNNDGGLAGKIVDAATQQVISGATVVIKNDKTGFRKTLTSDNSGSYRLGSLPIGVYSVTASYNGYDEVKIATVNVGIGSAQNVNIGMVPADSTEVIEVRGTAVATVDVTSSESALNISAVELERIPVPRDVTSVALLAPGTTKGDSRFGGASFGGSSVAENTMYINGLNVTNFRNGLGFSNVPYEFYDQFQVKTGGYSAEYGRSTGGVINAVTKSGTNDFEFGGSIYYQPKSLRETSPSVRSNKGDWYTYRENDEINRLSMNIYASGAIIEDTLFFYAIYNPRNVETQYDRTPSNGNYTEGDQDDAFWGAKIDWNITEDHRLEFLAFSDENEVLTDSYSRDENDGLVYASTAYDRSGGDNWSVKYTGYITDDLTVTALYGENEYDLTSGSNTGDECELIGDYRYYYGQETDIPINGVWVGCSTTSDYFLEEGNDKREAMRIDVEWQVHDDHLLRFGMDNETNTSFSNQKYSGPNGAYWLVYPASAGTPVNGVVMTEGTDYIRNRVRTVGGEFETEASAFYIEDIWTVTENITATIGIRNETFDNKNGGRKTFAKIDDMIAPRLGISWDINGDGNSKLFANVGRYFLPVANNTNVRLAGNESDIRQYFVLEGWNSRDYNGRTIYDPVLGAQIGADDVISDGSVPDTRSVVDDDLGPMAQDEIIIGYEGMINDDWSWGVKVTRREMDGAIDDMIIDHAIAAKFGCDKSTYHPHQYVLGNPGESMTVYTDTNCDGDVDDWATFTPEELIYDKANRKYSAVDLHVAKSWDGVWSIDATYTWAHSYGNSEGLVKSDNGQTDAGLTTDFDFPELMDGAYGNLPNDRRHQFKIFGTYSIIEDLTLGFNFRLESGRPINAFGLGHPNVGEVDYGSTYYLTTPIKDDEDTITDYEYTKVSRGSMGRTPWTARLDLNLMYRTEMFGADTMFKIDVFNVLNADSYTRVDEDAESSFGEVNDRSYGRPLAFQTPRYVQLTATVNF